MPRYDLWLINMYSKLDTFVSRLGKINIDVKLIMNYPWVYISEINGKKVRETFKANHGFTVAFVSIQDEQDLNFTDIGEIFKLIREYR